MEEEREKGGVERVEGEMGGVAEGRGTCRGTDQCQKRKKKESGLTWGVTAVPWRAAVAVTPSGVLLVVVVAAWLCLWQRLWLWLWWL